jgi:peptide-methionine (S)-S-oxide reductase
VIFNRHKSQLPTPEQALPGRDRPAYAVPERHEVLGHPLLPPYPAGLEVADFGMGCFWGAERAFWQLPGVWTTLVGYQGGVTPNPTYEEVCSGLTGHAEVVRVVFDPAALPYEQLLKVFWESHDPTQGMRQGNDHGTQYRSAIYTHSTDHHAAAVASRDSFQSVLARLGHSPITTEILPAAPFYPAEPYHQQYLSNSKNPNGYCGLGGLGVNPGNPSDWTCPTGIAETEE